LKYGSIKNIKGASQLVGQKAKSQWELYSDEELLAGAERWGLTLEQERQRIRILQSDFRAWPSGLMLYLKREHSNGLEFIGFTLIQLSVVNWLKKGNSVSVDATIKLNEVAVAA
jgi:hypothetical protein